VVDLSAGFLIIRLPSCSGHAILRFSVSCFPYLACLPIEASSWSARAGLLTAHETPLEALGISSINKIKRYLGDGND
jgi:hypothetical protein